MGDYREPLVASARDADNTRWVDGSTSARGSRDLVRPQSKAPDDRMVGLYVEKSVARNGALRYIVDLDVGDVVTIRRCDREALARTLIDTHGTAGSDRSARSRRRIDDKKCADRVCEGKTQIV